MKKYPEARQHFLQSCDGQGCGQMLVEFHLGKGFNTEYDLFIGQTVLQYLCLKKLLEAANVFRTYTKNHPSIKSEPPFSHPLLNFLWLLLVAIKVIIYSDFEKKRNAYSCFPLFLLSLFQSQFFIVFYVLDKSKFSCLHASL